MTKQPGLLRLLNDASSPYRDPLARLNWDGLDLDRWWLPPHALSLSGVEEFEGLSSTLRRRLSQCEYLHLQAAGLWLKSLFMRQICGALDESTAALQGRYLHEIREKAGHSLMFLELRAQRSAHRRPASASSAPVGRFFAPVEHRLRALLDARRDRRGVAGQAQSRGAPDVGQRPRVRGRLPHRHAAGDGRDPPHRARPGELRGGVAATIEPKAALPVASAVLVPAHALPLPLFPPPAVYEAAGFERPRAWQELAKANPVRRRLVEHAVKPTLDFLREQGWSVRV